MLVERLAAEYKETHSNVIEKMVTTHFQSASHPAPDQAIRLGRVVRGAFCQDWL